MNRNKINFRGYRLKIILIITLMSQSSTVFALGDHCWVDFYEYAQYIGKKIRLHGPIALPNLRKIEGENWEARIDSLVVGPKAKVIIYENLNYKLTLTEMAKYPVLMKSLGITEDDIKLDSELIFSPNNKSHHLGEFNFHKKTKSLKIECER